MIYLILGIMGDFQFSSGRFVYYVRRLWVLFNLFVHQAVTLVRFGTQVGIYFCVLWFH